MKVLIVAAFFAMIFAEAGAQRNITKTGTISFYSDAPLEKIEAVNRQVNAALDMTTGDFVFRVLMKSFTFEKALMQEHFNENYVESDKFPNATFTGKVSNIKEVIIDQDGMYPVVVSGNLTLHGVTKPVSAEGTLEVKQGRITGRSNFDLLLPDYGISIPGAVVRNVAKTVQIRVQVTLDRMNN